MLKIVRSVLGFQVFFALLAGSALASPPTCTDRGRELPVDNDRVIQLKKSAPLGKTLRAHVSGRVTRVFADRGNRHGTTHAHFEIQIGDDAQDLLEVVYSEDFGAMPEPSVGAMVQTCGDFINSYASNNGYAPSPSGAIIHWVHRSNTSKHDSGFVMLDNVVYGFGEDRLAGRRR